MAEWGAVAVASDPYTDFATGSVRIRAMIPCDFDARHPAAFVVSTKS